MLRVILNPSDTVLVCMPLWMMATPNVPGSTRELCAECDTTCWRAPGNLAGRLSHDGRVRATPAPLNPVILCPACAALHIQQQQGEG